MREIKFRGRSKRTGEWLYGTPGFDRNTLYINNGGRLYSAVEVTEHCEFTGLKDKNGKEIYEGDIVQGVCTSNPKYACDAFKQTDRLGKEIIGKICYGALYAQFYFTTDDIDYLDLAFGLREYEIIGNIYQYPELLTTPLSTKQ